MLAYATQTSKEQNKKLLDRYKTVEELINFYTMNGDEYFLTETVIEEIASTTEEKQIIKELINRKLFKRVYQSKIVLKESGFSKVPQIETIKKTIDTKLKRLIDSDGIFAVSDRFENNTYKDSDKKCILIAVKKDKTYQFRDDWKKIGLEFELANMNVSMIRIYLRRTFSSSVEYEEMKRKVMETVKEEIDQLKKYPS